jgi:hypothetical protein
MTNQSRTPDQTQISDSQILANQDSEVSEQNATFRRSLPPAAQRALAEAAERRAKAEQEPKAAPKEVAGPKGPEPTRYGDWERKGIVSDF